MYQIQVSQKRRILYQNLTENKNINKMIWKIKIKCISMKWNKYKKYVLADKIKLIFKKTIVLKNLDFHNKFWVMMLFKSVEIIVKIFLLINKSKSLKI